MPIISQAETRSLRGKLLHLSLILLLSLGGVSMIYPFLLMLSGSMRSQMDSSSLSLIPSFLTNDKSLYRKFLETKYNQSVNTLNQNTHQHAYSFNDARVPAGTARGRIADVQDFFRQVKFSRYWWVLGGISGFNTTPPNLRRLRTRLAQEFHGSLRAFGRAIGAPTSSWNDITPTPPNWLSQRFNYHPDPIWHAYFQLLRQSPVAQRYIPSITGYFLATMIQPKYGLSSVAGYNRVHTHHVSSFTTFVLPDRVPPANHPLLRQEWLTFVHRDLNPSFVLLKGEKPASWQSFLAGRYTNIAALNISWHGHYPSFGAIPLPHGHWFGGDQAQDYAAFLRTLNPSVYRLTGPGYVWRAWLRRHYHHNLARLNATEHTHYPRFADAQLPMDQITYQYVRQHSLKLRWDFATLNYVNVFNQMIFHGRAMLNTLIYCALAILAALLVNPLAAYSMSRFRLPGTYKMLLILMATMAFPPMVTMIPVFIILRHLHLLNTFGALVLPSIANGYMIFLLKGFFDSLPRELYEAARIDGASELRMFFQITLALSKPILAWVALGTFVGAYTNFLGALIVCPARHMWLISVWLYQFEQQSTPAAVYAAVLIASIPTLMIFLLAQRTIIRGIVVPVEK